MNDVKTARQGGVLYRFTGLMQALLLLLPCLSAQAATLTVGSGQTYTTIQAAVNAASDFDTIEVMAGTYNENVTVDVSVDIIGAGAESTIVDGGDAGSVFYVIGDVDVYVTGLTITNGTSDYGGGIYVEGASTSTSWFTLEDSIVEDNAATVQGGGIYCYKSAVEIRNSTISGNSLPTSGSGSKSGGGICADVCVLAVINCTISGNAAKNGGGLYLLSSNTTITHGTITSNTAGTANGGVLISGTGPVINNSIVVGNSAPTDPNISGSFTDNNNLTSGDPKLAPLADNGGPTPTHALLSDSPALDAVTSSTTEDQRGVPRPQGTKSDQGAYETVYTAYVDGDYTEGDCDGHVWGQDAFTTVSAAIAAVPAGGTVNVAAGTYTESVTIGKALTLTGTSAVIDGNVTLDAKPIAISGVTLDAGNSWIVTANAAIQEAITASSNGDTISVQAGTFSEAVTVNKAVTLKGANFGVAGNGSRGAESKISAGTGTALTVSSDGVTVDGFELAGATGVAVNGFENVAIRNNLIGVAAVGVSLQSLATTAADTVTVSANKIALDGQTTAGGTTPTVGIGLAGASGAKAVVLSQNVVQDAYYGYLLYAVLTDPVTTVSGGSITGVMQGVAVVNVDPLTGTIYAPSAFAVDGTSMSGFTGSFPAAPAINFHAGVYVFTDGNNPATLVTGLVNNVTIVGTGKPAQNSAALYFGDFSTVSGSTMQNITVLGSTAQNNINRGMIARGANAVVAVKGSTFTGNGSDPYGLDGNEGYGVSVLYGATVTLDDCAITNPATVTAPYKVYALLKDTASTLTVHETSLLNNGNASGVLASGTMNATRNWWGASTGPAAGMIVGNVSYTPWYTEAGMLNLVPYDMTLTGGSVAENAAVGTSVGTLSSTDDDAGSSFTYTLVDGTGDADNDSFQIDGNAIETKFPFDFESKNSYSVRVQTDDGEGGVYEEAFTIAVTDLNENPVLTAIGAKSVDEETQLSFTATATDQDLPAQTLTFSLGAGAPAGASITSGGAFTWTPTEAQGPGPYSIEVIVTDSGAGNLADSETIVVTVGEVNLAPVLGSIGNKSVNEQSLLSFMATATDADIPAQGLTFSLGAGAPAGASITAGGAFTWTPDETQGGTSYDITVVVSDGVVTDSETISVTVNEANVPPVLAAIGNKSVNEQSLLTFTAAATDADLPAQTLSYSLDEASVTAGMSINPSTGVFTWTPSESQGGASYDVTVTATDNGANPATLTDSETFSIAVAEVNVAPVLAGIGNKSVDEMTELTFTATATDQDLPAQGLTFSLSGAPAGASITAGGVFTWTPTEEQGAGPGTHIFTVVVTDNGTGNLTDSETITVTVNEANVAPVLAAIGNQAVDEQSLLTFTASATDADVPAQTLSYSLDGASVTAGMSINPSTGVFTWTPSESQGGASYNVTVTVTDNGANPATLTDSETISIAVTEVNVAPVLAGIGNKSVDEMTELTFTATATDQDLTAQELTFSLVDAPSGAVIDPASGVFTWTPAENQGPGSYTFTVVVTDNGANPDTLTDSETITVTVNEANIAPVAVADSGYTVFKSGTLTVPALTGVLANDTDADLPANTLEAVKVTDPAHGTVTLNDDGSFTYENNNDADTTDSFTYKVNDGMVDSPAVTVTITIKPVWDVTQNTFFDTIQAAIDAATANDTIRVASGTYQEQLTITKALTLNGNDGAILDGTGLAPTWTTGVKIRSGNVTFNNIDVQNYTQDGITAYDNIDMPNLRITNCKISNIQPGNWGFGIYVGYESEGFEYSPPDLVEHLDFSGLLIENNEIVNTHSSALVLQSITGTPGTMIVRNNNIHDNTTNSGIWIDCARELLIEDNQVTGNKWGVEFSSIPEMGGDELDGLYGPKNIILRGNQITGSAQQGIAVYQGWPSTFVIEENVIQGNGTGAQNYLAATLDASLNYWGDASGPAGAGDDVAGNVDYIPFYTEATFLNLAPYDMALAPATVAENAVSGTAVGTLSTTDDDAGDIFTYTLVSGAGDTDNGSFTIDGDTLKTAASFDFETKNSYSVCIRTSDGVGAYEEAFTVTVTDVNEAPVLAVIGPRSINEQATLNFTVSATDVDADSTRTYSLDALSTAAGMVINPTTGAFSWTPLETQGGATYSVTCTVTDNGGLTDSETFNITVNEVNVAPVLGAIGDRSVDEMTPLTFTATATDQDRPDQDLTFSLIDAPAGASITAGGAFSWTPDENQGPVDHTFTVVVTDNGTGSLTDSEQITVTVREVNLAPVAVADSYTVAENGTLAIDDTTGVLDNDTDADLPANTLHATKMSEPAHGTVALNGDGSFTYVNNGDEASSDSFTYKIDDGTVDGNTVTVSLTITPVNDTPTVAAALPDLNKQQDFTTFDIPLAGVFADAENDALSYSAVANGVVGVSVNGSILTVTALANARDVATVTVTATEVSTSPQLSVSDSFTITVKPVCNTTQDTYFDTVQAAIDAAAAGNTITVAAGTYAGNLTINKSLVLRSTAGAAATTIAGAGVTAVTIAANDVELSGFTITNPTGKHGVYAKDRNNLLIAENVVTDIGSADATISGTNIGIGIECGAAAIDNIIIRDNIVSHVQGGAGKSADGIAVGWSNGNFDVTNLVIENNEISQITSSGKGAYGILLNHASLAKGYNGRTVAPQIIDNTITDLDGLWAHAIGLEGNTPNAVVQGNTIARIVDHKSPADPDAVGVMVEDNASAGTVTITENSFLDVLLGVRNVTTTAVTADGNYWDSATPYIPDLVAGLVTVRNYYTDAALTTLHAMDLYVDDDFNASTPGWGSYAFAAISTALSAANPGDTIHVADGTYTQAATLTVAKRGITLTGESRAGVVINSSGLTGTAYGILVSASDVTLEHFTLVPTSFVDSGYPIHVSGSPAILSNVTLRDIEISGSWRAPFDVHGVDGVLLDGLIARNAIAGFGINITSCSNVEIVNCETSGNAWGGVGLHIAAGLSSNDGITIDLDSNVFGEIQSVSVQDPGALNLDITGQNYRIDIAGGPAAGYLDTGTLPEAIGLALYYDSHGAPVSGITDENGDPVDYTPNLDTGTVYVDDNWAGTPAGAGIQEPGAAAGTYLIFGHNAFAKVQDGVNAVDDDGTVTVAAGTYTEQVEISHPLTLDGAGAGQTIIKGFANMPVFRTVGTNNEKPVVYIHDTDDVVVQNLTVDGDYKGNTNYRYYGMAGWEAGFSLFDVVVINTSNDPLDGSQHGNGIYVRNEGGTDHYVMIVGCAVSGFQKNGITMIGANTIAYVEACEVTGAGPLGLGLPAQNGIQVSNGAVAELYDNTIQDIWYTPGTWAACGLLITDASGTIAEGNAIDACMNPVYVYIGSDYQLAGNTITGGGESYLWSVTDSTVTGDSYSGCSAGLYVGYSDGISVTDAIFDGNDYGLIVYGACDGVEVTDCTFTDNGEIGLTVMVDGADTPDNLTVQQNQFVGNLIGFYSDAVTPVDVSGNYWGADTGPSGAGLFGAGDPADGSLTIATYYEAPWDPLHYRDLYVDDDGPAEDGIQYFQTIGAALAAANPGDTIHVADGTYAQTSTLTVAKQGITITGESRAGVIIDVTACGASWGIHVSGDDVTLEHFTVIPGSAVGSGYPIHAAPEPVTLGVFVENLVLRDIAIDGAYRTAFDLHAVDGATLEDLVATDTIRGNGIQLTGCRDVTLTRCATSGNAWGGVAIYYSSYGTASCSGIAIDLADNDIDDIQAVYVQDPGATYTVGNYTYVITANGIIGYVDGVVDEAIALALGYDARGWTVQSIKDAAGNTVPYGADLSTATVYVDDNWVGTTPGAGIPKPGVPGTYLVFGRNAFATVQGGVSGVDAAGTVNVAEGMYKENVAVGKAAILRGPNAGKSGDDVTRGAEAIVTTAINDPEMAPGAAVFTVTASGVTVDGFEIDGDNTDMSDGEPSMGADINAAYGIVVDASAGAIDNISLENNRIVNCYNFGIWAAGNNATATAANRIRYNHIENVPYWAGVVAEINFYAEISNNTLVDVWRGIQVDNYWRPHPGASVGTIANNSITAYSPDWTDVSGILLNLQYASAPTWTVTDNQIVNGNAAVSDGSCGLVFWSVQTDTTVAASGNDITGFESGIYAWNTVSSVIPEVSGGTVSGCNYGVRMENNNPSWDEAAASLVLNGVSIQNSLVAGALVDDNDAGVYPLNLTLTGSTAINTAPAGILQRGVDATVVPGDTILAAISGNYIELSNSSPNNMDAMAVVFNGETGAAMDLTELLAVEDKITHKVDVSTLGLVRVKAGNLYVTTTSGSIQRGVDAATAGDTVNVGAGTYAEQLVIAKALTVAGQDGATLDGATLGLQKDAVKIKSGDVTFDNIDVLNFSGNGIICGYEASIPGNLQNIHITNCRIANIQPGYSHGFGIYVGYEGEAWGTSKLLTHLDYSGLVIENNEIENTADAGVVLQSITASTGQLIVRGNYIHGITDSYGLWLEGARNVLTENNVFDGNMWGVIIMGSTGGEPWYTMNGAYGPKDILVRNNIFTDQTSKGVSVYHGWPETITITGNSLEGNLVGVYNGLAGEIDAERNWWGSATGPSNTTNPGGAGDSVTGLVDFSPWLNDGTDTDPAIGFQPNSTVYYLPTHLSFFVQPGDTALGAVLSPAVVVHVMNEMNDIALQYVGSVLIAIGNNPGGGFLTGTLSFSAIAGVATFGDLAVTVGGGTGYTLAASTASPITGATSDPFDVANPLPVLTSLSPIWKPAGSAEFTLTVNGSGFVPNSKVYWNGAERATAYGSAGQLTATIPAGDLTAAAAVPVTVVSPAAGGGTSGAKTFTVTALAVPTVVWVDDGWTGADNSGTHVWGYDAFATIQNGVNAVADGGTVNVLEGTYAENPTVVSKQLNVLGATDVDGEPLPTIMGRLSIDHPGADTGWRIENLNFIPDASTAVLLMLKNVNNAAVKNCTFDGNGRFLASPSLNGISFESCPNGNTHPSIENCHFKNGLYTAVTGIASDLTVSNCKIENVKSGFNSRGSNLVIQNTDIAVIAPGSGDTYGLRYGSTDAGSANNLILSGCTISVDKNSQTPAPGDYHCAIYIRSGAIGTLDVNNCSIDGDVVNLSATALNTSGNWWGGADAATVSARILAGSVDYTPWLADGTDTDGGAIGFQGDFSALWVDENSPQTGAAGRIQEGVNTVTAGGTVNVLDGTYVEQVEITKDMVLAGQGAATVIKSPAVLPLSYTTSAANKPIVHVHDTAAATVRDFTVDGDGRGNANYRFMGVSYYRAGGLVENLTVTGVRDTPISGSQHGLAINAYADVAPLRTLTVTGCQVSDFQKNGITMNGAFLSATVSGNSVVGAGAVDFIAQNGIQFGFGSTGIIANNEVSGFDYTPESDESCGILVYASGVAITGNIVTASELGVGVVDPLASMGLISQNNFAGNQWGIYNYSATVLNAENNWFGDITGPANGNNAGGTGSAVYGNVDFSPWLGDETDTSAAIGFQPNPTPVYYLPEYLEFVIQPGDVALDDLWTVVLRVMNENDDVAAQFIGNVLIALGSNPGLGELAGALTQAAAGGIATFTDLAVTKGGGYGYTLKATSLLPIADATSDEFDVANLISTISTIDPYWKRANSGGFTLTVSGGNFVPLSKVLWNGTERPTTYVNAGQLTAVIDASDILSVGTATVSVQTPGPNANTTAALTFRIETATPTEVFVDDGYAGLDPDTLVNWPVGGAGTHIIGYDAFATVQGGVDAVAAAGTVNVAAGTYRENLDIDKALSLLGPNAGVSPNGGTRVAEAVIVPGVSDIEYGEIAHVAASDVTIKGFTFDGYNDSLPVEFLGVSGVPMHAAEAVTIYEDNVNRLTVSRNIIRNVSYFGVSIFGAGYSAPATTGHTVEDNLIQNLGTYDADSGVDYWGGGVLLYNGQYARVTGNTMQNVRLGVQTGNFHAPNPGAATFQDIVDNVISARRRGIFHNLHTGSPSPITLSGNTITAIADANETAWDGILLGSLDVDCLAQDNDIDGSAVSVPSEGYEVWNVSGAHQVVLKGGTVAGVDKGVWLNNYEGYASDGNYGAHATIDGLAIEPKATGVGIVARDSSSSTLHAAVRAVIKGGTTIDGAAEGLVIEGSNAGVEFQGTIPADFTDTSTYIALKTNGSTVPAGDIDATAVQFEGKTGSAMTAAEGLAVETKVVHKMDDASLGLVTWKANTLFVPAGYSITSAMGLADDGWTIHVGPGTFTEPGQILLDKDLSLIGAGAGQTILQPGADTTAGGNVQSEAWVFVGAGVTAGINGFTLDGAGKQIHHAIQSLGDLTAESNTIRNIRHSQYMGRGIVLYGGDSVVRACTFENIERIGVHVRGNVTTPNPVALIEYCDYTGKGDGDWLDYAFEVGGGGQATIRYCTVRNCTGVASTDGSTSAGALVTDYWGTGTAATLTRNTFLDNTAGIAVGYAATDASVVTADYNIFKGNDYGIDAVGTVPVDADRNYWGVEVGPSGEGTGTGDAVSTGVSFAPWWADEAMTQLYYKDVFVDDDYAGLPADTPVDWPYTGVAGPYTIGLDAFATVQGGVYAAWTGSLVRVAGGTYKETVTVDMPMELLGPNDGKAGTDPARVAEAVLMPDVSDPSPFSAGAVTILYIAVDDVTVKGFTFDGDNPDLTSGKLVGAADVDACEAVASYEGINGLTFEGNILRNTGYSAMDFYNYNNGGKASTGSLIRSNLVDNIGHIPYGYGVGLIIYNNFYAGVTANTFTNVRVGVQTGNYSKADPGDAHTIANNVIASTRRGIFHNLAYSDATAFEITGNAISVLPETGATRWDGILLSSFEGTASATLSGNRIVATDVPQLTVGIHAWNDPTAGSLLVDGGSVDGADYGVWVNDYDGYGPSAGGAVSLTLQGLAISNASLTGVYVKDNPANPAAPALRATLMGGVTFFNCATGLVLEGAGAGVAFQGVAPASFPAGAPYIELKSNGESVPSADIDATAVLFDGKTGADMTLAEGLAVEANVVHKMDDTSLGLVTWKAQNVYVLAGKTIQEAIGLVGAGWTINVGPGDFTENGQIVIDKNLTIVGSGDGVTTIRPNQNTGTSGNARGWFLVNAGVEFNLTDVTLDGDGFLVYQGIRMLGHGSIAGVEFKNIQYQASGPAYQGVAVAAMGDGHIDISGSTFSQIGRIGVIYFGSGVNGSLYSGNTYTGKGDGDWLDYGVELGGGAQATVQNSTFTACTGVASSDGSTSAGALATTFFGAGTAGTFTGNTFAGNTTGISVGYDGTDTSAVTAENNKFMGNIEYGIYSTGPAVAASPNYWGDETGPVSSIGPGTGDAVSDDVSFSPWWADEPMTILWWLNGTILTDRIINEGEVVRLYGDSTIGDGTTPVKWTVINGTLEVDKLMLKDNATLVVRNGTLILHTSSGETTIEGSFTIFDSWGSVYFENDTTIAGDAFALVSHLVFDNGVTLRVTGAMTIDGCVMEGRNAGDTYTVQVDDGATFRMFRTEMHDAAMTVDADGAELQSNVFHNNVTIGAGAAGVKAYHNVFLDGSVLTDGGAGTIVTLDGWGNVTTLDGTFNNLGLYSEGIWDDGNLYVQPGDVITVNMAVDTLRTPVQGAEALMGYNTRFFGGVSLEAAGGAWANLIWSDVRIEPIGDTTYGQIDTAVGVTFDPASIDGSQDDSDMLRLSLTATDKEGITRLFFRPGEAGQLPEDTQLAVNTGMETYFIKPFTMNTSYITVDGTPPETDEAFAATQTLEGVTTDLMQPGSSASQGTVQIGLMAWDALAGIETNYYTMVVTNRTAALGTASLSNAMVSATPVLVGTNMHTRFIWNVDVPATVPNDVYDVTITVYDRSGNGTVVTGSFTVFQFKVIVELESVVVVPFTRTVRLVGKDAAGVTVGTWDRPVTFTNRVGMAAVPGAQPNMATLSAKTAWTLRSKIPVPTGSGLVSFVGVDKLLGGDLTGDNAVSLVDYTQIRRFWLTTEPSTDIDASGGTSTLDYFIMRTNWYKVGDAE